MRRIMSGYRFTNGVRLRTKIRIPSMRWPTFALMESLKASDCTDPAVQVDHEDRDGLNNRRYNLRVATHDDNQRNRSCQKRNNRTSQYKGVCLEKGKWRVRIRVNGKNIEIGRFDSELQAALAYDKAAREHYGEFACCNFPLKK